MYEFNEVFVFVEVELVGEVEGVIFVFLDGSDFVIFEDVLVDVRSDVGEFGNEVYRVFEGVFLVFFFVDVFCVGLGEGRGLFKSSDGDGELCYGVKVGRVVVDEFFNEFGEVGVSGLFGRKVMDLLFGRDFVG